MFGLGHVDMMPLFAGLIYALGILSMWHKFKTRRYFGAITELAVFILLMKLHGGTLAGGVGATIAALIVGMFISPKKRSN